jgi:hypothetical protein
MFDWSSSLSSIAIGVALSACCGFRVFIPLLAAALVTKFEWVSLPAQIEWLGSWTAIISFGTAALLEMTAYYIPFIDNLLDLVATPLATAAGTLVAYNFLPGNETGELLQWVAAIIVGGAGAGTVQAGTGLVRLASTKTTAGTGNGIVASGENLAAITGATLSFLIPILMALIFIILIFWILKKFVNRNRSVEPR